MPLLSFASVHHKGPGNPMIILWTPAEMVRVFDLNFKTLPSKN